MLLGSPKILRNPDILVKILTERKTVKSTEDLNIGINEMQIRDIKL